ncbi:MAG: HlyC/CorC family transporter, partial [Lachnospiraceae bacterium]|nr:HlyC/CorC family transporter [Lachnospiraceae bacterium]
MDAGSVTLIIILVFLILLSAFFSSAETALMTASRITLRTLEEDGNKRAALANKLTEDPQKLLSAILIGNNIANLTASALATVLASDLARNSGAGIRVSTAVGIATGVLTLLVLIFGEIIPKTMASEKAVKMSLAYARPIWLITIILTPLIFLIGKLAGGIMFLMGRRTDGEKTAAMTEDDLKTVVDVSHEEGIIESEEKEMIKNLVDFGDSQVKDVMVPRIDVTFAELGTTLPELKELLEENKYTRIPVFSETKDNVVGIINVRDLFYYKGDTDTLDLSEIMRKPFFTYEFHKTSDLFHQMREEAENIAIVLDEYGATAGLVTMEDIVEEIVGEIRDEFDAEEEEDIEQVAPNEYLVEGSMRLEDLDEMLGTSYECDDYDS